MRHLAKAGRKQSGYQAISPYLPEANRPLHLYSVASPCTLSQSVRRRSEPWESCPGDRRGRNVLQFVFGQGRWSCSREQGSVAGTNCARTTRLTPRKMSRDTDAIFMKHKTAVCMRLGISRDAELSPTSSMIQTMLSLSRAIPTPSARRIAALLSPSSARHVVSL